MTRAIEKPGFTFVEILSPCPVGYGKSNGVGEGIDEMRLYRDHCVINDDAGIDELDIDLTSDAPIMLGTFADTVRRPWGV